jgi:hypothetical protein
MGPVGRFAMSVLVLAASSCRFDAHGASGVVDAPAAGSADALVIDAPAPIDAPPPPPIDAPPPPTVTCTIGGTTAPVGADALGSIGRSGPVTLACPTDEVPIGLAFDTTPSAPTGGWTERAITAVHLHCARIDRMSDDTLKITPDTTVPSGSANCGESWTPVAGAELDCPAGSVITAFTDSENQDGGTLTLFDHVGMSCTPLDATGSANGSATTVAFTDTGTDTGHLQAPACGAGTAALAFTARIGCGIDGMTLDCAPLSCQ